MAKTKALPGKRFCKKCSKMIPIHCRICGFCNAPQYTMQQIKKEYKKRQKTNEEGEDDLEANHFVHSFNPFEIAATEFEACSVGIEEFLKVRELEIVVNGAKVRIAPFEAYLKNSVVLMNVCGRSNLVAFSFGSPSFLVVSICEEPVLFGHVYESTGIIQVWQVTNTQAKPEYCYSFLHSGYTALDMKFFPSKSNKTIGTLAVCLANGDLSLYNLPLPSSLSLSRPAPLLLIQALSTFKMPGVVFSCLCWSDSLSISAGSQDGSIFTLNPGYAAHTSIFEAHRLPITSLTYNPSSNCLISTGLDGHVKAWDDKGHLLDSLCLSKRWNYHVTCNPTGKYIFFDNDAAISPHKIAELKHGKLESKKQISHSTEATLSSCFSPVSNFDYVVTAEGYLELIYVSELEKNSKKRKTPWNRYSKLVYVDSAGNVKFGEDCEGDSGKGSICQVDLCCCSNKELVAWAGTVTGIYSVEIEDIVNLE